MQLNSVIDDLKTGSYQVTRPGPSVYLNGIRQAAITLSTFPIDAIVVPVSGRALQNLPEAQRTQEVISIRTAVELKTRTDDSGPDQISVEGSTFEVFQVHGPWKLEGEIHYRAFASRRKAS